MAQADYISKREAMARYGVTYRQLERWIAEGAINEYQRAGGSRPMLRTDELEWATQIVPRPRPDDYEGGES